MKLLALIMPVAFVIMPTIAFITYIIIFSIQGKDPLKVKYPIIIITRRVKRLMLIAISVYFAAFVASVFWSIYILAGWNPFKFFTDTMILFSVFITLLLACAVIIPMVIGYSRLLKRMTPPPTNGFLNESEYLDWNNKFAKAYSELFVKAIPKYALLLLTVSAVIIALTILFGLYNRAK
ncbi:MAG: hypothetical protein Q7R34_06665 [Dehalococcoidia bacterium]|nr:hypothetical protein [Dehalococcoidia bacterium]